MKWFEGSIAEAVTASKLKKAVFVVFVEGKDDTSQEVARNLDSDEVSSRLESDKFVAIKLQSDSENYTFFVQIYQLVPIPSIFFIGESGAPLEIIGNPLPSTELAIKIDSILRKAYPQTSSASASFIESEQKTQCSATQNVSEASTSADIVNSAQQSDKKTSEDLSQEEKVLRARKLIELQNKKKMEEEERKEREREIERRKMGKDVQKLRQQQQDKELREAHEERMREKAADAAAREKILRQIEEDKLERKRKYEIYSKQEQLAQQQKVQERNRVLADSTDMTKARIQFKLPSGNNVTGTFEATNTLSNLRTYVIQNAQLPYKDFSMSSFFPRRDFTSADNNKSLLELELVPSSVILILPKKSSNSTSVIKSSDGAGVFSHFFWTLFAPVVSMYNYIVGYFTGRPRDGNGSNNQNRGSTLGGTSAAFGGLANMGMRRMGGQGTSKIKSRGNIHTLHSGDNDNDENNTWNGNSTQQM